MWAKHCPITTANSSQTKGLHMSEKNNIFSQKLQEEVHKFRPVQDHYAHLIMGSHFDKYSEFYHLTIYVPQNRKYL
jgi:hypothetical protein